MKADPSRLAYTGKQPGTRQPDDWFTPAKYIESARKVLGGIDLDPFSSDEANKVVKAARILTKEMSALDRAWDFGVHLPASMTTCFMNPPYSNGMCARAIDKFLAELLSGHIGNAIVLTNNCTDTRWFKALYNHADSICFTDHRIAFWNADGKAISGNTRGQAFFYFGGAIDSFEKEFVTYGLLMRPVEL